MSPATEAGAVPPPIAELVTSLVPRVVVLDIDGTTIDGDLRVTARTRDAVRAAGRRVPVVLATGRMYQSALPWARELEVVQPLVCYQGALVREVAVDGRSASVLFEEGLSGAVATRAVSIARRHGWHVQAYIDDQLVCDQDRPEAHIYTAIAQVPIRFVPDLLDAVAGGSTKIVCVSGDPAVVDECIATMRAELGDTARVTRSMEQFVEVVSPRVNKAVAVDMVCARLGTSLAEAVAVGDAPNDTEMLAAAGIGVAVRGARAEVLGGADATCAGPAESGVAEVLERFGLAG